MLIENHDREGLTPTEEAVAIQHLAGFEGITQKDITTMTGIKAGVVRSALKVASSEVATAIGERHDLTLEQLLVLAEFDTDTEAVKALTVSAVKDPARFDHVAAQLGANATTVPLTTPSRSRSPRPGYPWSSWTTAGGFPTGRPSSTNSPHRAVPGRSPRPSIGPAPVTPERSVRLTTATRRRICASTRWATATSTNPTTAPTASSATDAASPA